MMTCWKVVFRSIFLPRPSKTRVGIPLVDEILTHKTDIYGQIYFQIRWFGSDSRNDIWASVRELLEINDPFHRTAVRRLPLLNLLLLLLLPLRRGGCLSHRIALGHPLHPHKADRGRGGIVDL
jgi:hypothetical protein